VQRGVRTIAVTGDSAGGNLALTLLSAASRSRANSAHVVGAVVLSPVTDLAMTGPSWQSRAEADPYFVRNQADTLVEAYLNGHDARDASASPLYGDLSGLPPIRVHVGDAEVLLDDSVRYVERAAAAGVDARVEVWEGLPHGFIGSLGRLDAAAKALTAIGAFLSARLAAS
jgi:epsilon-lactone hydrolase